MAANPQQPRSHLSLDIEPELHQKIAAVAAAHGVPLHDYIVTILQRALDADEAGDGVAWARLSARSFARDWDSDADQVYDSLPSR